MFIIAVVFLLAGKIETVTIDKRNKKVELRKTSMCCVKTRTIGDLNKIFGFNGFKKGHEGFWMSTVEYIIRAEFKREKSFIILTSRSRTKITLQVSKQLSSCLTLGVVDANKKLPRR